MDLSLPFIEDNDQTLARRAHLDALRELVGNVYPNKFERSEIVKAGREDTISSVVEKFRGKYGPKDVKKYYSKFDVAVSTAIQ